MRNKTVIQLFGYSVGKLPEPERPDLIPGNRYLVTGNSQTGKLNNRTTNYTMNCELITYTPAGTPASQTHSPLQN